MIMEMESFLKCLVDHMEIMKIASQVINLSQFILFLSNHDIILKSLAFAGTFYLPSVRFLYRKYLMKSF